MYLLTICSLQILIKKLITTFYCTYITVSYCDLLSDIKYTDFNYVTIFICRHNVAKTKHIFYYNLCSDVSDIIIAGFFHINFISLYLSVLENNGLDRLTKKQKGNGKQRNVS